MDMKILLSLIGVFIGVLQTIMIFILAGMRSDIAVMWKRLNNHYHEVECANTECRSLHTGNVIIPRGSE